MAVGAVGDGDPLARIVHDSAGGWRVQQLLDHLCGTADRAAEFASAFGAADWARLAGLWHDLGKGSYAFQAYLRASSGLDPDAGNPSARVDHSTAGAIHAIDCLGVLGRVLAYTIAGHHAGLADWHASYGGRAALGERVLQRDRLADVLESWVLPEALQTPDGPASRPPVGAEESLHLFIRMLYSCLVDADSLDAEAFTTPAAAPTRATWPSLDALLPRLQRYMQALPSAGPVNRVRAEVLQRAVEHAADPPGFFSLTVPTGGGKTLTSLSFALSHARANGQRRVIYAIPYLSIVEQTADVFRSALGDVFLEHHSNIDVDDEDWRSHLAAENWDAPIIVTTAVQLFESLYAARRGRCRKLHRIARSVIILDEAQLLPPNLLDPIVSVLRLLVEGYGVSVVLCTATQPALAERVFPSGRRSRGLPPVTELAPDPAQLAQRLRRVSFRWPPELRRIEDWDEVAGDLARERQVLCVVNTRADARALAELVPGSVHLSALMCPEHRAIVIAKVRSRLAAGEPVRLISTQLVEAGVDIDFPVVYRALAGLDSIAQAAGRCNREGRCESGTVVVFVPPQPAPPGHLRQGEAATRSVLAALPDAAEAATPDAFRQYFELLYSVNDLDRPRVLELLTKQARGIEIQFRTAAERFRMIEDASATVFVPFGSGSRLIEDLCGGPTRERLRRLQRFGVSLRSRELETLRRTGLVDEPFDGIWCLRPDGYDRTFGVRLSRGEASLGLLA